MNTEQSSKIKRASWLLSNLCLVGVVLIPLLVGCLWMLGGHAFFQSGEPSMYLIPYGYALQSAPLTLVIRLSGFVVSMLPNALLMLSLWHLKCLFEEFYQLNFFTSETVKRLKGFSVNTLLYALAYPLSGGLLSLVTSLHNPAGHRVISITAGDTQLFAIFIGLVILLISWVMGEGKRLSEENEQFV